MMSKRVSSFVFLVCLLCLITTPITAQENTSSNAQRQVITVDNIANLELGFALPNCRFSADWQLISWYPSIYNLWEWERLFDRGALSNDGRFLIADGIIYDFETGEQHETALDVPGQYDVYGNLLVYWGDAAYEIDTGKQVYAVGSQYGGENTISPDGRWLSGDYLYDAETGWQYFPIETAFSTPNFNPDSSLIALMDGAYDVPSGEQRFATNATGPSAFSPDGTLLAVAGDGVYDVVTGERLYTLNQAAVFSPDGSLIAVDYNGVYDAQTGELLFPIAPYSNKPTPVQTASFNPDGTLMAVTHDGIYDTDTGERLFVIDEGRPVFSPDGTLMAISKNIKGNEPGNTGQYCLIYGIAGTEWPVYGFAMVAGYTAARPISVNVRRVPNGTVIGSASHLLIFAQNNDGTWFKVAFEDDFGWVAKSVLDVIFLPDDLAIQEP